MQGISDFNLSLPPSLPLRRSDGCPVLDGQPSVSPSGALGKTTDLLNPPEATREETWKVPAYISDAPVYGEVGSSYMVDAELVF